MQSDRRRDAPSAAHSERHPRAPGSLLRARPGRVGPAALRGVQEVVSKSCRVTRRPVALWTLQRACTAAEASAQLRGSPQLQLACNASHLLRYWPSARCQARSLVRSCPDCVDRRVRAAVCTLPRTRTTPLTPPAGCQYDRAARDSLVASGGLGLSPSAPSGLRKCLWCSGETWLGSTRPAAMKAAPLDAQIARALEAGAWRCERGGR